MSLLCCSGSCFSFEHCGDFEPRPRVLILLCWIWHMSCPENPASGALDLWWPAQARLMSRWYAFATWQVHAIRLFGRAASWHDCYVARVAVVQTWVSHIAGGLQNLVQRVSSSQMHLLQIGISCLCFQRLKSGEIYNTDNEINFTALRMIRGNDKLTVCSILWQVHHEAFLRTVSKWDQWTEFSIRPTQTHAADPLQAFCWHWRSDQDVAWNHSTVEMVREGTIGRDRHNDVQLLEQKRWV